MTFTQIDEGHSLHSRYSIRHLLATDLYREIKDPVTVQNALKHSSITITNAFGEKRY
jgi:site-specific recombinase XerD